MADQHDPSEPQDEQRRPGLPRQPEPLDRDPWAPPAQRVAMDKAAGEVGAADSGPTDSGPTDSDAAGSRAADAGVADNAGVAHNAVGVGEQDLSL
ncbi:hypothetical protein JBE27_19835, partial [Streptomyces albiflaviniger]|nr:hypothetical protein [Streptomyces albiflaviniger]